MSIRGCCRQRSSRAYSAPAPSRRSGSRSRRSSGGSGRRRRSRLTLFPISFLSGVFFPLHGAPDWVLRLSHFFPLSHLVEAFTACFSPYTQGSGFAARDLVVLAGWAVAGLLISVRRFHWDTEESENPTRRRRLVVLGSAFSGRRT